MQQKIIWVLVADAGNARFIEKIGSLGGGLEIHNLSPSPQSAHEYGPNQPGRGLKKPGITHHAYETHTDEHNQQDDHFAKEIVTLLNEAHLNKKFDELHVLAPAKMLSLIRHHITNTNHHIGPKVSEELTKDALSFSLDDLEKGIDIPSIR